jgi:hypothetical protein
MYSSHLSGGQPGIHSPNLGNMLLGRLVFLNLTLCDIRTWYRSKGARHSLGRKNILKIKLNSTFFVPIVLRGKGFRDDYDWGRDEQKKIETQEEDATRISRTNNDKDKDKEKDKYEKACDTFQHVTHHQRPTSPSPHDNQRPVQGKSK